MCSERGQATIDYVALIAVVAIVLGLAVGVAPVGAAGIVNAVTGQIRHALCVVGGGPCPGRRSKPCVVSSRRDLRHYSVSLLIVRLDHDRWVLREAMSDGTVRLTVARSGAAGLEGAFGASARVSVDGRRVGAANEARASAQLALARGTVYVARDEREAGTFMRAIATVAHRDRRARCSTTAACAPSARPASATPGSKARPGRHSGRAATGARARRRSGSAPPAARGAA